MDPSDFHTNLMQAKHLILHLTLLIATASALPLAPPEKCAAPHLRCRGSLSDNSVNTPTNAAAYYLLHSPQVHRPWVWHAHLCGPAALSIVSYLTAPVTPPLSSTSTAASSVATNGCCSRIRSRHQEGQECCRDRTCSCQLQDAQPGWWKPTTLSQVRVRTHTEDWRYYRHEHDQT